MKLNHFALVHGSKIEHFGRRKKEQDAVRIDAAIKIALDELDDYTERRTAFMRLVECVRACTPLLKPTLGRGTPGCARGIDFGARSPTIRDAASGRPVHCRLSRCGRPDAGLALRLGCS